MDESGAVNRVSIKFKLSGQKRYFHDKSRKSRVKSLSSVGKDVKTKKKNDMGTHMFPRPQQKHKDEGEKHVAPQSKVSASATDSHGDSFKLTKLLGKLNDNSLGDCCSTVPRMLRTAMRKRRKKSIDVSCSGGDFHRNDLKRKFSQDLEKVGHDFLTLSKEEEEVAETLSSLASMFDKNPIKSTEETATVASKRQANFAQLHATCEEAKEGQNKQLILGTGSSSNEITKLEGESEISRIRETNETNSFNFTIPKLPSEPDKCKESNRTTIYHNLQNSQAPNASFPQQYPHNRPSESVDAKLPPWLDAARSTMKPTENAAKEKRIVTRKRCATHLSICRLIQNLRTENRKDETFPPKSNVASLTHEHQRLFHRHPYQKQTFNFLSLSAGDCDAIEPEKTESQSVFRLPSSSPWPNGQQQHIYYNPFWAVASGAYPYHGGQHTMRGLPFVHQQHVAVGTTARLQKRENCSSSYEFGAASVRMQLLCKEQRL